MLYFCLGFYIPEGNPSEIECQHHSCFITNIKTIILIGYTPTARLKNKHGLKANQPNFLATKQNYTVSTDHLAVLSCAVQQLGTKTVCIF